MAKQKIVIFMKQENGKKAILIAVALLAVSGIFAWENRDQYTTIWTKTEPGKPDSTLKITLTGDTSLIKDTMKLLKRPDKDTLVSISDSSFTSPIVLIKQ